MKATKGISACLVSGMLALTLCVYGCGAAVEATSKQEQTTEQAGAQQTTETPNYLTDEEQAIFDAAVKGTEAENLKPTAVLATQVVAGLNYAFLCQSADTNPTWHIAVVYRDPQGTSTLSALNDIDLDALQVSDQSSEGMMGAWEVCEPAAASLPKEAATAFSNAVADYEGVELSPIALLSTQMDGGTNHRVMCVGTTIADGPVHGLYVASVHEDPDGSAEITSAEQLALTAYVA
ncbi:MAG: hypothetical protein IKG18_07795 [Atopobiaceae bacterium]|nr:hypothetical protein [Atopobiaceae bacterium]